MQGPKVARYAGANFGGPVLGWGAMIRTRGTGNDVNR
jgi:hypothetical protein